MVRRFAERSKEAEERDIVLVETLRSSPFTVHLVGKNGGVTGAHGDRRPDPAFVVGLAVYALATVTVLRQAFAGHPLWPG